MPIVIDGDGTVTGISAGGLTDDCVTASDLANSINTDIATGVTAGTTASAALPKAGGTMTGNIAYVNMTTGDSGSTTNKIRMGAGSDLVIHHDGANSYIEENGTGALRILSSEAHFRNTSDNTVFVRIDSDGLKFGADTAAANALDDYEEGTWTPGFAGSTGGTGTLTSYGAWYTKVGRLVYVSCYIVCTGLGDMSGDVRISGLPFTVLSAYSPVIVGSAEGLAITAGTSLTGHTRVSDTYIKLQHWDLTTGLSYLDKDEFTADGGGVFTATYMA